jgi:predicted nucleotidyltransferase
MKLKEKYTVEYIESNKLVLLKTLVGSYSQNLQTENSDKDYYGIFILENDDINSLEYRLDPFDTVISTSKDNDITYIEIGKFLELLYKNNPNALEVLASSNIQGNWVIKSNLIDLIDINKIISKKCLDTFGKYATSQIKKATGLNKKMNNPIPVKKKSPLDFCYLYGNKYFKNSTPIVSVLKKLDVDQKFLGLKPINHCKSTYEVYCDYHSYICFGDEYKPKTIRNLTESLDELKSRHKFGKLKGIVHPDEFSSQIRISKIPDLSFGEYNIEHLGFIYYNLEGYESYLKDYREYREWVEKRNPERHKNNLGQKYDVKNLSHCARLLTIAKEIAEGKGLVLKRTEDKDFFINIKLGKVNYEEILDYTNNIISLLPELYDKSSIQETVDLSYLNDLLIKIRK